MSGIRRIVKWSARYIPLFIAIIALSIFLQWLYSYLPLFVQYSFAVLGYGDIDKVELPMFLKEIFKNGDTTLNIILMVSGSMVLLQAIRSVLRFIDNYMQGALAQYIGHRLRTRLYKHICDLPFSYHSNSDVGDLIQRSTSDIDQVSNFVSVQVPNFIGIFVTVGIGAFQVAKISTTLMLVSLIIVPITAVSTGASGSVNNVGYDSGRSVAISGNIQDVVLSSEKQRKNSTSFAKNVSDVDVLRPDFQDEAISIKITVPGMGDFPVTTEINVPMELVSGRY
jgi:ABC-type multidrug transport system fused ATPase/permease subunit